MTHVNKYFLFARTQPWIPKKLPGSIGLKKNDEFFATVILEIAI